MDTISVNGKEFEVLRLLGKGKGGYSYLVSDGGSRFVAKQIHHEPCEYYSFGDKTAAELSDYERLFRIGVPMPRLIDCDRENERILKEYIDGDTVYELVKRGEVMPEHIAAMREVCKRLYAANTNIDYFPTNFILRDGILYYVDYECNDYMEEWDFEHWGIKYWSRTKEFLEYEAKH